MVQRVIQYRAFVIAHLVGVASAAIDLALRDILGAIALRFADASIKHRAIISLANVLVHRDTQDQLVASCVHREVSVLIAKVDANAGLMRTVIHFLDIVIAKQVILVSTVNQVNIYTLCPSIFYH